MELSRRSFCQAAARGVASCVLAGCVGPSGAPEGSPTPLPRCGVQPGTAAEGWIGLPLSEHPALVPVGGQEILIAPQVLLDVNVVHTEPGCYVAAWRVCPHGACYLTYETAQREFVCPCHGSRFGEDGALLEGPAERGLKTFPAGEVDGVVWVKGQGEGS